MSMGIDEFERRLQDLVRECGPDCHGVVVLRDTQQARVMSVNLHDKKFGPVLELLNTGIYCVYTAHFEGKSEDI